MPPPRLFGLEPPRILFTSLSPTAVRLSRLKETSFQVPGRQRTCDGLKSAYIRPMAYSLRLFVIANNNDTKQFRCRQVTFIDRVLRDFYATMAATVDDD